MSNAGNFNGVYIRKIGKNNLPVYIGKIFMEKAIWLNPKNLAWTGGEYETYKMGKYSMGTIFSVISERSLYCPENILQWRQYTGDRWTEYHESRVKLESLSFNGKF